MYANSMTCHSICHTFTTVRRCGYLVNLLAMENTSIILIYANNQVYNSHDDISAYEALNQDVSDGFT
jgi:hypothetical protein